GRLPDLLMGDAGQGSAGRVPPAAQPLGGARRLRLRLRPGEQPDPGLHRRGQVRLAVARHREPTDIYFNKQQVAYVSEQRPSISIMDTSGGKVLARFDTPGSGHGLWVDSAGDIYLAEAGGKR